MRAATLLLGSLVTLYVHTLISYLLLLWYNVWFTSPKQTVRKFHCFCFVHAHCFGKVQERTS